MPSEIIHYSGQVFTVKEIPFTPFHGRPKLYEIVEYPAVGCVVATNDDNQILLISQFRPAINATIIELPAGKLDAGETALVGTQRELQEETGYIADNWEPLFEFYSAPGFCTEYLSLFSATKLTKTHTNFDEDEDIDCQFYTKEECRDLIKNGKIKDAKTLIGIQWFLSNQ